MSKKISKSSRKSTNHISDILESMNQETRYLTPIFGTEASDIEMPNKKINEKYGLENKVENISIVHSPKVRLRDIISPYIWPVGICTTLVFVYAMIRYRKLGAFRTLGKYIVGVLGIELLYLSLIALTRLPINQLVIPVGLLLYTLAIIIVTVKREIKLEKLDKVEN